MVLHFSNRVFFCKSGFAKIKNIHLKSKTHIGNVGRRYHESGGLESRCFYSIRGAIYLKPVIISSPSSRDLRSSRAAQYIALAVFIREHDSHMHVVSCFLFMLSRPPVIYVCVFASRVPRACLVCLSYRSAFGAIIGFKCVFASCVPRAWLVCLFLCFCVCLARPASRFNDEAIKPSPSSWAARRYVDRYNLPGLHSMAEGGGYQRSGL